MVPPDAAVVAQAAIVPHLSQRTTIYMLEPLAPDGDYVIAQADLSPWPNATRAEILRLVLERERRGYFVVVERDGWTLLRRTPAPASAGDSSSR